MASLEVGSFVAVFEAVVGIPGMRDLSMPLETGHKGRG